MILKVTDNQYGQLS